MNEDNFSRLTRAQMVAKLAQKTKEGKNFIKEYDKDGNLISEQWGRWDNNGKFIPNSEENFVEVHDKDGNLISKQKFSGVEQARLIQEQEKFISLKDKEIKLELMNKRIREKQENEREPDEEPKWTEVRGSSSFYFICPICGSMIPGTGPLMNCSDGTPRGPVALHEWWHKTIHCDWYQD